MTIEAWKTKGEVKATRKKAETKPEKPINGPIAVIVCIICFTTSGLVALRLSDPDQGKLISKAEVQIRIRQQAERIANDPLIPPRVKAMALGILNQHRAMGIELRRIEANKK